MFPPIAEFEPQECFLCEEEVSVIYVKDPYLYKNKRIIEYRWYCMDCLAQEYEDIHNEMEVEDE